MSLEEYREKRSSCHCWLKVDKHERGLVSMLLPWFAKVCKILQLLTLEL